MVLLVDATGSMTITRSDGVTRFEAARTKAMDQITAEAMAGGLDQVAVYTFSGEGFIRWSGTDDLHPFVGPTEARNIVRDNIAVTFADTPLADALCTAADIAVGPAGFTHELQVFTDGGENSSTGPCSGPPSTLAGDAPPYQPGSWQHNVYVHLTGIGLTVGTTLFHDVTSGFAPMSVPASAENDQVASANARALIVDGVTDEDFFASISVATGGDFTEVSDSGPLPVLDDLDGDLDVDRNDAIELARNFGGLATRTFDLNNDGKVGYADYAIIIQLLGTGRGTPAPDPYVSAPPVKPCDCHGTLVIDGKTIQDAGVTIAADNPCNLVIRNSLIVSGSFALKTRGALNVTVDNSIIVGETSWLSSTGNVRVNAANSVFHGVTRSNFRLTDRGGNTFE